MGVSVGVKTKQRRRAADQHKETSKCASTGSRNCVWAVTDIKNNQGMKKRGWNRVWACSWALPGETLEARAAARRSKKESTNSKGHPRCHLHPHYYTLCFPCYGRVVCGSFTWS